MSYFVSPSPGLLMINNPQVLQLAAQLAMRVAGGEVMYLHCWGGHGRTGTVVSIMLHLMYGLNADEAMERCQHVHDVRRIPISVGSPQTDAQREQVRRVIWRLGRRSVPSTSPAPAPTTSGVAPVSTVPVQQCPSKRSEISTENSEKKREMAGVVSSVERFEPEMAQAAAQSSISKSRCGAARDRKAVSGSGSSSSSGSVDVLEANNGVIGGGGGCQQQAAATAAAVVGGRRGWVRGRRQAFAQAPNGVGEEVSGWLPREEHICATTPGKKGGNGLESDLRDDRCGVEDKGSGRRLRSRVSNEVGAVVGEGAAAAAEEAACVEAGTTSARGRRKSSDPPVLEGEHAARGGRSNRLRRKSAPGQSPRSAEVDFYGVSGEEDEEQQQPTTPGATPNVQGKREGGCASLRSCLNSAGVMMDISPGSCTGVERYVSTRSSAGDMPAGSSGSSTETSRRAR